MVKVIQDLWIISIDGMVLFDRVYNEKIDPNLFGAMMSALNSFAAELSEGGLSSFQLSGQSNFSLIKMRSCLFVGSYKSKNKEKKVIEELKVISEKFLSLYAHNVENFDGEVSIFLGFEEEIKESLDQVVDTMQKGFW